MNILSISESWNRPIPTERL